MDRFFELVMLADQSLVQAGWVPASTRDDVTKLLAAGPSGRGPLPLPEVTLKWTFEPRLGITTAYTKGRMTLLSVLLGAPASPREPEVVDAWMAGLRGAAPVKAINGDDAEAFEIFRRVRERPFLGSVLLPEGSREECKALLDVHHAVASAFFGARW